jgi:hypothetical protein
MAIRFACKCGKHLRAGDTMAGRHTLCPKCGALVAIPSPEDAAKGAASARPQAAVADSQSAGANADDAEDIGPILLRVKRKNDKDPNRYRKSVWVPLDPDRGPPPEKLPRPVKTARRRYDWQLESRWYHCLTYPFRAWPVLLLLSLAQTGLLLWAAVLIPRLSAGVEDIPATESLVFLATMILVAIYSMGLFDCVLASSVAGEYRVFRFPGIDLGAQGAAACLSCFLAGPIAPAAIGIVYWVRCGDPNLLDWIIMAELAAATFGYWLFELLAIRDNGGWVAGPATVLENVARMWPRSLLAAVGMPCLGYLYIRMVVAGLVRWHVDGLLALPYLAFAQLTGMFGVTFLLRVIGVWSYHSRPKLEAPTTPIEDIDSPHSEKDE